MHGGHLESISAFSWNPHDPWVMASAADDNALQVSQVQSLKKPNRLQIWQPASNIYAADEDFQEMDYEA